MSNNPPLLFSTIKNGGDNFEQFGKKYIYFQKMDTNGFFNDKDYLYLKIVD